MTKTALLVGCNYPGTEAELGGCVNDVLTAKDVLTSCLGFDESNITVMIDTDESYAQPTGSNIKGKLREMISNAQDGDVLFFHFSGHGVQVPSPDNDESDGKDEAICPTDNNLITDDDLREIFMPLGDQPNTKLTFIADCCHSGTLLDHQEVVIAGDKTQDPDASAAVADTLNNTYGSEGERGVNNRSLPFSTLSNILSQKTGVQVTNRNFSDTLGSLFGPDAGKKVTDYISAAQSGSPFRPAGSKPENLLPPHVGVLITGCQATETSADCAGSGAMSNALYSYIKTQYDAGKGDSLTYRQLVLGVRDALEKSSFTQNPCLECDSSLADTAFVTQVPVSGAAPAADTTTYGQEPAAETTTYGEAAETTTYGEEPAAETTTYGEAAETTTYGEEPAAETTTYGEEPAAETTTYGEAAETTTYGEEAAVTGEGEGEPKKKGWW